MTPAAEVVPALFHRLVDDAGLFPPAQLLMPAAVRRHRAEDAAGSAVLTSRFLCPAHQFRTLLDELARAGAASTGKMLLGLISPLGPEVLPTVLDHIAGDDRVVLAGVEGPSGDLDGLVAVPAGVPCFVELPVTASWARPLRQLADAGLAAKVRCGGTSPVLFPTPEQLGRFVHACAREDVPFKATAGLHHALPYRDPETGFDHHGFLNLLLVAARAAAGAEVGDVIDVLSVTDAGRLAAEASALSPDEAAAARRLFVAYGSCSTAEPLDDLRRLGLVRAPETELV